MSFGMDVLYWVMKRLGCTLLTLSIKLLLLLLMIFQPFGTVTECWPQHAMISAD